VPLKEAMIYYEVPAVSMAVIDQGQIAWERAYTIDQSLAVSTETLFQAASISKAVTALAALVLVQRGQLHLDEDVNTYLKTWHVPANTFTANQKVTLRHILSHTSGLTVAGFPGYAVGSALPSLLQVLDGQPPANTPPIRVTSMPGTQYFYSGGGYVVLQQLMMDVTAQDFPELMNALALTPLNMRRSVFASSLPQDLRDHAIPAFLSQGQPIPGGWHHYPELAAAALWSTPRDLALFVIGVMDALLAKKEAILTPAMAQAMLTKQTNTGFGLGVVIDGDGRQLNFRKEGHNLGYHCWMIGFPYTGQGAVVMANSESGLPLVIAALQAIAKAHEWPSYSPLSATAFR
jgi:CubicO group peptidase (beta-lactamase class C family)